MDKEQVSKLAVVAAWFLVVACSAYSSAMNMEAVCSFQTSVNYCLPTWHHIPEHSTLKKMCPSVQSICGENIICYLFFFL
jgi:hypothetical protein